MRLELPRPVVRTRARLHSDHAGRQRRNHRAELRSRHLGLAQLHPTPLVDTVHGKYVLRQIDTGRNNGHGSSLSE